MKKILVTGASGQIGSELVSYLRERYGQNQVIATDINLNQCTSPCEVLDVLNVEQFETIIKHYEVDTLIHLAAVLSAKAEDNIQFAWKLNMEGLLNGLELAKKYRLSFFSPSSIGAFGDSPVNDTPQHTIMRPSSIYGITKVAGELLCDYYYKHFNVDTRSLRFPGLISSLTLPGGGTTDYAVEVFYSALKDKQYCCPLREDTMLDMMYMDDALKAIVDLMECNPSKLTLRNAYNVSAMSFTPKQLMNEIQKHIPEFTMTYEIDPTKQQIADSWPNFMDVSIAQQDFNFACEYNLEKMTKKMLEDLAK